MNFRDDPTLALVFGVGKRICPGRHFVDATLFIVIASVLAVFNVTKANDENGREIPVQVTTAVGNGIVMYVRIIARKRFLELTVRLPRHPGKFECSISPRDKLAEDLVLVNALS
jgi:hypothetical protein